jgi:hypothetical protein
MATSGYIYAWRVPIAILTGVGDAELEVNDKLCLLKVGRTDSANLALRMYNQKLAWGKLLGTRAIVSTDADGNHTYAVRRFGTAERYIIEETPPNIPYDSSSHSAEEALKFCADTHLEMKNNPELFEDLAFFLPRTQTDEHQENEGFVRALIGVPVRASLLKQMIDEWNDKSKYRLNKDGKLQRIGEVTTGQVGYTEYVLTTVDQFNSVRAAFLNKRRNERFTLKVVTKCFASRTSVMIHVPNVKVQLVAKLCCSESRVHCVRLTNTITDEDDLIERFAHFILSTEVVERINQIRDVLLPL